MSPGKFVVFLNQLGKSISGCRTSIIGFSKWSLVFFFFFQYYAFSCMLRFINHGVLCELPENNSGNTLYMDLESCEVHEWFWKIPYLIVAVLIRCPKIIKDCLWWNLKWAFWFSLELLLCHVTLDWERKRMEEDIGSSCCQ